MKKHGFILGGIVVVAGSWLKTAQPEEAPQIWSYKAQNSEGRIVLDGKIPGAKFVLRDLADELLKREPSGVTVHDFLHITRSIDGKIQEQVCDIQILVPNWTAPFCTSWPLAKAQP